MKEIRDELHGAREELHGTRDELHGAREELHGTREELRVTNTALANTREVLSETGSLLIKTCDVLEVTIKDAIPLGIIQEKVEVFAVYCMSGSMYYMTGLQTGAHKKTKALILANNAGSYTVDEWSYTPNSIQFKFKIREHVKIHRLGSAHGSDIYIKKNKLHSHDVQTGHK